jgi:small-conductance mechanosensitive channel
MDGIPLQKVRSNASATGARKAQATVAGGSSDLTTVNEKGEYHHGGRRKRMNTGVTRKDSDGPENVALNAMGRLYTKIVGFSAVTRYLIYVVPVGLLLAIPLIVLPTTGHRTDILVGSNAGKDGPPLFLIFLWIEVSWLSLWVGKSLASVLPQIFMFLVGVVSPGTRKYANVIRALEIPISLFLWALVSWVVFRNLVNRFDDAVQWVVNVQRLLGASFASSGVYLAEKALVQLIGISYHQRSFALRIKDSKREIHLLGLLYDASRTLFPMYCPEFEEEDYVINDSIDMLLGRKGGKRGGSATPMRLIGDVSRFGDKVTSVFGNIASEITGKKVFNPNSAHSIVIDALEKVRTSEALAKRIWMSFVVEGNDALYIEDIQEVLGPAYRDEADEAFAAVDGDGNGDISLEEMVRKVVDMGKERKAISEGMKDISQALSVFDKILLFVVLLIVVFIFMAFFQSSFLSTVATAGTALLSLSFVFAVTTQEFLGSCIFLFVKHPYDVADRVDIANGGDKVNMVVEKISLLYTVFTRIDKMQVVQIPNIQLNSLWIENVTRSKAMNELVKINVSYDTSLDDIELLRFELEQFVRHPDNSRDFQPDLLVSVGGVGNLDQMELNVSIKHKSNWHNDSVRSARRSKFMCALALALKRIPIYGPGGGSESLGAPGNPSYSVTVSDEMAAAARAKAEKDKEAKRMVPSKSADADAQAEAAVNLNTHKPTIGAFEGFGYDRSQEQQQQHGDDKRRSIDIESIRAGLTKGPSQSGRRKPGEGVAPVTLDNGQPGLSLSPSSPVRSRVIDEESQVGGDMRRTPSNSSARPHYYSPFQQGGSAPGSGAEMVHPMQGARVGDSTTSPPQGHRSWSSQQSSTTRHPPPASGQR